MVFERRPEKSEGVSHAQLEGESLPGRENSMEQG